MIPRIVIQHENGLRRICGTIDILETSTPPPKISYEMNTFYTLEKRYPNYVLYKQEVLTTNVEGVSNGPLLV